MFNSIVAGFDRMQMQGVCSILPSSSYLCCSEASEIALHTDPVTLGFVPLVFVLNITIQYLLYIFSLDTIRIGL